MRLRSVALALALSLGGIVMAQAATKHKPHPIVKHKNSKASRVKPRKARKIKTNGHR